MRLKEPMSRYYYLQNQAQTDQALAKIFIQQLEELKVIVEELKLSEQ